MTPAQKKEMLALIKNMEKRVLPFCKKYGVPMAEYNHSDHLPNSTCALLNSIDKLNPNSCEGLFHQSIRFNYPKSRPEYLNHIDFEL